MKQKIRKPRPLVIQGQSAAAIVKDGELCPIVAVSCLFFSTSEIPPLIKWLKNAEIYLKQEMGKK